MTVKTAEQVLLFRQDAYARDAEAEVIAITDEGGVVLDQTLFYPTSGGQPGDSGAIEWSGGRIEMATCIKTTDFAAVLIPAEPVPLPPIGARVTQHINWERRHRHMRVHTALHLLSVVIPKPVTGGQIGSEKGRLDFLMERAPGEKAELEAAMNRLIGLGLAITESVITDDELAARPELVKTMSVAPPTGTGQVRLVRIGPPDTQVDLQPCGGTHVANTHEIGEIRLGKIENKGASNRRVNLHLMS